MTNLLLQILGSLVLLTLIANTTVATDRPNIVVILADDMGWADVGLSYNMGCSVARLIQTLKNCEQLENTIVFFASDNGGHTSDADNRPLRGHKGQSFEGGVCVPAVKSWPGKIKPDTTFSQPAHIVDLFPTFVRLAGGKVDGEKPLEGIDL